MSSKDDPLMVLAGEINALEAHWANANFDASKLSPRARKRRRLAADIRAASASLSAVSKARDELRDELKTLRELRALLPTIISLMEDIEELSVGESTALRRLKEIDLEDWV